MKKLSILISILIISVILLNGCGQKETKKYIPSDFLDLEVGKTAKTSKIEIKLISAERVKSYYDLNSKQIKEVNPEFNTFILFEAELKNMHSENILAGAINFYLVDDKGAIHDLFLYYLDESEVLTELKPNVYYGEDELDMLTELKPNEKIKGKILCAIFEPIKDFKIQYDITALI